MRLPQDGGDDAAPVRVLMKADPSSRESLQAEAEIDPMDGEQTWPTESELLEAEGAEKTFCLPWGQQLCSCPLGRFNTFNKNFANK